MSNDRQLQEAVLTELNWDQRVTAAHIGVTANAGVVTLTGHVDTFAQKQAAEDAAWRIKGVKAVAEEIEVRLAPETQRRDEDIATAAIDRLAWDVSIPRNAVKVRVEDGWVTLTGQVDGYYQKVSAEEDIRRSFGVVGVSNQIEIKPQVNIRDISDSIMHALHRSWFFDPKTISVSAQGGKVRLSGTVRSPHDRAMAAATAWAAHGVTQVENDIAIV